MAELTDAQRQMMALALSSAGPHLIPGAAPILGPDMRGAIPPAVTRAIAPNLGINFGQKGDFVTGVNPPLTNESDPRMMMNNPATGDQSFERRDQPWWNSERLLRRT